MKIIVVAYDKNRGIGAKNDLLWLRDLPSDLKHFRDTTMNGAVIMGRNTYESIGHPLAGRQNIVISRQGTHIDGVTVVGTLDDAYAAVEADRETYVMGGGQIYALAFDSVDQIMATEVGATFDAATIFFPRIDPAVWQETSREHHEADERNKYAFDFVTYRRR